MVLLLCGFSGFFVAEFAKRLFQVRRWLKLLLAFIGSFAISAVVVKHTGDLVGYGFAGAGLAVIIHKFQRLASLGGDWLFLHSVPKSQR